MTYFEVRRSKIVGHPASGPSKIDAHIEHARGSYSGGAEIVGTVVDQWGGALCGVSIRLHSAASGQWRNAMANADGQFRIAALPAGDYEFAVLYGADQLTQKLALAPRDRANLSVLFRLNAPETVVAVNENLLTRVSMVADNAPVVLKAGVVGGVPGGVAGGVIGGVVEGRNFMALAAPAPARIPMAMDSESMRANSATLLKAQSADSDSAPTHVRSYFPEALYINPEIITDHDGRASVVIPLADSITTWRMAMLASTTHGALGSATSSLKVFQDFFVDLDLPVTLTQGDRVSLPVAVYNYSNARGDVNLKLQADEVVLAGG